MYAQANIVVSVISLLFAIFFAVKVLKKNKGSKEMQYFSSAIHKGALVFLEKEYEVIILFVLVVFALLTWFFSIHLGFAFILGAVLSGLAGFSGMMIATEGNVRTAQAAKFSIKEAIDVAFTSSTVMGLAVTGFGLLGVSFLYYAYGDIGIIYGFALGASSIALFARVGGGIFTKAADVAADFAGKLESGMKEDDPRNPASIADNVGDEVGDVAGMGADLFESYVSSMVAAMAIAVTIADNRFVLLPMIISSLGIISSIIVMVLIRLNRNYRMMLAGAYALSGMFVVLFSTLLIKYLIPANFVMNFIVYQRLGIIVSIISGIFAGVAIGFYTKKYTFVENKAVQDLAKKAETGVATIIIEGLALGMKSTISTVIILCISILVSYYFASIYGVAISAVALLSTLGVVLAVNVFGPISDNAQGIAQMAHLGHKVRERTAALDSVGNTTSAISKGYAVASSAFTCFALFSAFIVVSGLKSIDLVQPSVLIGLLLGGMLPFFFSSVVIKAVGEGADLIIREVRRQFKHIIKGNVKPDYNTSISISTRAALRKMAFPSIVAASSPIVIGFLLGPAAVGGLIAGSLLVSIVLATTMFNAGAAWDNAKRYVEDKRYFGKVKEAVIVGDTVGDPLKDTAAPSLNILVKLISIVSLIAVPLFLKYGYLIKL